MFSSRAKGLKAFQVVFVRWSIIQRYIWYYDVDHSFYISYAFDLYLITFPPTVSTFEFPKISQISIVVKNGTTGFSSEKFLPD